MSIQKAVATDAKLQDSVQEGIPTPSHGIHAESTSI